MNFTDWGDWYANHKYWFTKQGSRYRANLAVASYWGGAEETLFVTARPRYAVLTADPARLRVEEETVSLLDEYDCEVYYTDEGIVTVISDGSLIQVSQP